MKRLMLVMLCLMLAGGVSAQYGNYTSFNYNITAGAGTQTNYQMKFILSNASGISGYYSGDNVIFTNGTTRADWYDINATDGSGNPVPFWVENGTTTAKNCTAWVNAPSIAVGNTSTGRWYYGDAAQSSSTMDGINTFLAFEDFNGATINSSQWYYTTGLAPSGGTLTMTSAGATKNISSAIQYGRNYSIKSRLQSAHVGSGGSYQESFGLAGGSLGAIFANVATATPYYGVYNGSWRFTDAISGWSAAAYHTMQLDVTSSQSFIGRVDSGTTTTVNNAYYGGATTVGGAYVGSVSGSQEIIDWMFISHRVSTEPTTSNYTRNPLVVVVPINASFTQSPNPSSTGQAVSYTDSSTGSPVTWNWTLAGTSPTNTTQNAAYTYTTAGVYNILLNVTNSTGSWSNTSQTHTVVNASGFTPQDIWMVGQFTQTFHITDSSTGLPIPVVQLQDTAMQTYTTTNGTGYLTEAFGSSNVVYVSSGYNSKSISYVFDGDATWDVQLTPSTPGGSKNTWYSPHQVRLEVWNSYGNKMEGIAINATANYSSMPDSWITNLYGIDPDVANDMLNKTLIMAASTGSDGAVVFTMHGSISYDVRMTNPVTHTEYFKQIMPKDEQYILRMPTSTVIPNLSGNVYSNIANTSLTFAEPNNSYVTMGLQYQDTSGTTSSLKFYVAFDNGTVAYTQNLGNPGTSAVLANYTTKNIRGLRYIWNYTAVRT